jgi:tRNA threonylcarbamoyladenosine biosynthesis protein TsaE
MLKDFKEIITNSAEETVSLGRKFAQNAIGGEIICLQGDLGAGKTTFSQGFLREMGIEGALTSPTFVVMKQYVIKNKVLSLKNIYHIDTYRVESEDILTLGWEEILADKKNIILVEWPEKIKDIIPPDASWLEFKLINENQRKIILK